MFQQKKLVSAIICSTLVLTACNENDDDNVGAPSATTTITVTPSLGKILNGRIALKNAKTGATLAPTQTITPSSNGTATFTVPVSKIAEPVLAEVLPTTSGVVEYFDEALEDNKKITVAAADIAKPILRAAASVTANANIGVTGLTEAAVQQAEKQVGGLITQNINSANEAVKNALKLNFDVTQAPVVVGKGEFEKLINASISNALEAQRKAYATYLATLAKEAQRINSTSLTPAYDMAKAFANDFAHDGKFDAVGSQTLAINYTNTFLTNWLNWVQNFYASFLNLKTIVDFNIWYGGFNIVDKESVKNYTDAVPIRTVDGVEEYACSGEGRIKSSASDGISMDFVNQRGSNISIYWLNYQAQRVSYRQNLATGQTHSQGTFVTHPWLITDNTGACMAIYKPITKTNKTITFKADGSVMIGNGTPVEEVKTPATINAGLVKNYSLKYNLTQNGGGYTAGQTITAIVSSAGDLVLGGFVLKNPYYDKVNGVDFTGEVIWKDGNLKYALSNNITGAFNEINVFDTNKTNQFLGQFVLETPAANTCSSTGNDSTLGFRNAPSDFCSFSYTYGTSTNAIPDEYIFQGSVDKTTFAKVNVLNGNVQSFRVENNTLGYACGVGSLPACVGITIQSNTNSNIEFKFANAEVANVDTTKQGMIIDSGLLMHKKATQAVTAINLAGCLTSKTTTSAIDCGAQVLPDFSLNMRKSTINVNNTCTISKSGDTVTATSGADTISAKLNQENNDVARIDTSSSVVQILDIVNNQSNSITLTYSSTGTLNSVIAQGGSGIGFFCSPNL